MINEIKRRLDRGETVELECVDVGSFKRITAENNVNERILRLDKIIIDYYLRDAFYLSVSSEDLSTLELSRYSVFITARELKYFKIKEGNEMMEDQKKSFDKLMDVAIQALKDGCIHEVGFKDGVIKITDSNDNEEYITYYDDLDYYREQIESLYSETFVIEDLSCILKINENIHSLVLANGCDITDKIYFEDCGMYLKDGYGNSIVPGINILKGATVIQKKSNV